MNYLKIFDDDESNDIFEYLKTKNYEYHKPYMRFGKMVWT